MQKLSTLIFSRDDVAKTMGLVNDIADVSDQVVLMYSGKDADFARLRAMASKTKGMVEVYITLALGYPDPLREYGLHKCRNDWVLYIDTDERVTKELKRDLRKIINRTGTDAYAIKRYEHAHLDGRKEDFFTWQMRLYNKRKIYYRGLVHEQPVVEGTLGKLEGEYGLLHIDELKEKGSNRTDYEYNQIRKYYDRLSYTMLNDRIKEYLEKLVVPEGRIEDTALGKSVLGWMHFYEKLTARKMDEEISTLDYFTFYSMIEGVYTIKRKDVKYFFGEAIPSVVSDTKRAASFKDDKESERIFEISKALNKEGMIKYLKLDNDRVVERLYQKYKHRKQGIGLLMKLLEDRYSSKYP